MIFRSSSALNEGKRRRKWGEKGREREKMRGRNGEGPSGGHGALGVVEEVELDGAGEGEGALDFWGDGDTSVEEGEAEVLEGGAGEEGKGDVVEDEALKHAVGFLALG